MHEDLVERLTSMIFANEKFSQAVLRLSEVVTRDSHKKLMHRISNLKGLKPSHIGISEYFTLDSESNLMEVFKKVND